MSHPHASRSRRMALFASAVVSGCTVSVNSRDDELFEDDPFARGGIGSVDTPPGGDSGEIRSRGEYGPEGSPATADEPPPRPDGSELDGAYQSLIVTDPAVLAERGSAGDEAAVWSFRALMGWLSDDPDGPSRFALGFLESWADGSGAPPRPGARSHLIDGWVDAPPSPSEADPASSEGQTPDAGGAAADDVAAAGEDVGEGDGGYLPADGADGADGAGDVGDGEPGVPTAGDQTQPWETARWQDVPFRLIAIVPRVDLAGDACGGFAGELRYVYAGSDWRYERDLSLTLIVEIPLPASRTAGDWARAFLSLEGLGREQLGERLAELTGEIARQSDPLRSRVRTNEVALAEPGDEAWELREFRPAITDGRLELRPAPLEFTPRADADPGELASHILDHAADIRTRPVSLPDELRAMAAQVPDPDFRWDVPGLSDPLLDAFSVNTCNGCHGGNTRALPFQHVAPASDPSWPARLSPFLWDPDAPSDELRRRASVVAALAEVECEPSDSGSSY